MNVTQGAQLVQCRYCPAKAVWATFATTGRRTLVDPQPVLKGNIELTREHGALLAEVIPPLKRAQHTELYMSHFASCTGAKSARGTRRRQTPGMETSRRAGRAV